jgi:TolB-like protein/Flp pilus assembly protein TadD
VKASARSGSVDGVLITAVMMGAKSFRFASFTLDLDRQSLVGASGRAELRPKSFAVLRYLVEHAGRVVGKHEMIKAVWPDVIVTDESLTRCISEVRRAIGDEDQRIIKTVSRRGYLLDAEVSAGDAPRGRDAAAGEVAAAPALPLPDHPSIAVLPFSNLSGDPEQQYFADGVVEDIITALSHCDSLFVIARNSSFTYRDRAVDVRRVGRELGVRYVLEGSVRRAGSRLRISGQLVDALSGVHIWADHFDGDASDVFELQDRITESVVAAVEPKLQAAELERLKQKPAVDLSAYDLLLRAQALEYEYTQQSLTEAIRCLEQAIAIGPSYARALALAAYCRAERRQQGWSKNPEEDTAEGFRLATRALELGRDDANVLWTTAFAVRALGADSHRSRELARRSLELNPNSALALTAAAWAEVFVGNPLEALHFLRRAERLSPRDPKAWYMAAAAALAHFALAQYEEAAGCARKALAQNPRFAGSLRALAASLAKLGRVNEASEVVRELLNIEPQLTVAKLHWRLRHMDERVLNPFLDGLRIAGLPE